ncbi:MAG: RHS repeat-associated core domain-containing protein, partial [Bacteroidales bacterium]|nr:RHS repeat-associated core domain-containing protein [Bacteroidales bacterium]
YKNSSNGHPVTVTYNDMQNKSYTTTITYDAIGRQTSITDPDAGTVSYQYDALDRITKQTDARGNVTTNTYNAAGLLTKTVCGDITTTYTYDNRDRVTKESTGSQSVSYTYDNLNRLTKKTYTIDGTNLAFSYTYNANGKLGSKTFPDGETEIYTYGGSGKLQQISVNSQRVWERSIYTGTVRQTSLGPQPLNLTRKYSSKGMLVQQEIVRQAGSLHKMTYTYNDKTGNLTSRTGMFSSAETFSYDNFDRLIRAADVRIDYDLNGNITSKTGIGGYTYDNDNKPHVVRQVQNTNNLITTDNQTITYNAFNKASTITQGGDILSITYGPSRQRCKTVLISGGTTTTTLYADNYEQRTIGGNTTTYHYVDTPDGIAAILVKKGLAKATPYYVETDHLGSITNIYDYMGDLHFSATYDAWGVQSVTRNNLGITRGYCSHEHWPQFGLIDMNERFYDPLLGRFLSPDPYVQAPENPQNLNRYSYCLNNPLKYTDPSGEFAWLPVLISGAIFGTGNVLTGQPKSFGQGVKMFAQGAIVGAMLGAGYQIPGVQNALGNIWNCKFFKYGLAAMGSATLGSAALGLLSGKNNRVFQNSVKISGGIFSLDDSKFLRGIWQGISRFTWEALQTNVGLCYALFCNIGWQVDYVNYCGGATYSVNEYASKNDGVTLGNYIGINIKDDVSGDFGQYVRTAHNGLFMHEYGHTIQGRRYGLAYLFYIGIPSLKSAKLSHVVPFGSTTIMSHKLSWFEREASAYARDYFGKDWKNIIDIETKHHPTYGF